MFNITRGILIPMMVYRLFPCWYTRHWIFSSMFDEPDEEHFAMTQQELAFKYISWFPPGVKVAQTKEEFKDYNAPTFVVSATKDIFGGGETTAERAKELFNDVEVEVVEAAHVPAKDKMDQIMRHVAEFFERKGFPGKES